MDFLTIKFKHFPVFNHYQVLKNIENLLALKNSKKFLYMTSETYHN